MIHNLATKVQEFSAAFDAARQIWDIREGLHIDYQFLDSKPFDAIMFFTMYAHERPFSNPRYPVAHRIAILKTIGASDARETGVNDKFASKYYESTFAEAVWNEFKKLLRIEQRDEKTRKVMEKYTEGSVRTILEKLRENGEPNIINLLTSKTLKEAYEFLKELDGISHKIAALFLRDARSYFGGWDDAEDSDLYCVQPVDRWVKELAAMCWGDVDTSQNVEKVAIAIVKRCRDEGIDPIAFNKGAWFIGAHFQKLCSFFKIETTIRLSDTGALTTNAIYRFAPEIIKKAIETLGASEAAGEIYPL